MTPDEHQRERMRLWIDVAAELRSSAKADYLAASLAADKLLSEFDKRFPAPSAAAPVEPVTIRDTRLRVDIPAAELASLRQKARLWDAVASGKVRISVAGRAYCTWNLGNEMTSLCDTAEEAVEAAIAAGALK